MSETGLQKEDYQVIKVAYCSAKEDEFFLKELEKQFSHVKRLRYIATWDKSLILGGMNRQEETQNQLSAADIVLVMVSSDLLKNDELYNELTYVIDLHRKHQLFVIPIILRPCIVTHHVKTRKSWLLRCNLLSVQNQYSCYWCEMTTSDIC